MEIINPNFHVSRSMAAVLAIDNARGRVNEKCVVSPVAYKTTTLAYIFITESKISQFTREFRNTAFSGELIMKMQ